MLVPFLGSSFRLFRLFVGATDILAHLFMGYLGNKGVCKMNGWLGVRDPNSHFGQRVTLVWTLTSALHYIQSIVIGLELRSNDHEGL